MQKTPISDKLAYFQRSQKNGGLFPFGYKKTASTFTVEAVALYLYKSHNQINKKLLNCKP
jgi:hypothetical protein